MYHEPSSGSEDPYWDPSIGSFGARYPQSGGSGSGFGGGSGSVIHPPPSLIASSRGSKSSDGSKENIT